MSPRTSIAIVSVACLLVAIFIMIFGGRSAVTFAMAFVMTSLLGSAVANALQKLESRLKGLEERLAKCERTPASAP
jgi:hypothetical protein